MKDKSSEVFINALSVGWHLAKIKDSNPKFIMDWEKFVYWLEHHKIKGKGKNES